MFRNLQLTREAPDGSRHNHQDQSQSARGNDAGGPVALNQFSENLEGGDRSCGNRFAFEVAIHIRKQGRDAAIAIGGILPQAFENDELEVGIDLRIDRPGAGSLVGLEVLDVHQKRPGRGEMAFSGDHLKENRSERIDIRSGVNRLARGRLLGGHIFDRSQNISTQGKGGFRLGGAEFRKAKISHEGLTIGTKEDISRLQIPVEHAVGVGEFHSGADLQENRHRLLYGQLHGFVSVGPRFFLFRSCLGLVAGGFPRGSGGFDDRGEVFFSIGGLHARVEDVREREAIDKLHHDVMAALVLVHLVDAANIPVLQAAHHLRFSAKALHGFRGGGLGRVQRFDGHNISVNVVGSPHAAHAAMADHREEAVFSKTVNESLVWHAIQTELHMLGDTSEADRPEDRHGLFHRARLETPEIVENKNGLLPVFGDSGPKKPYAPLIRAVDGLDAPGMRGIRAQIGIDLARGADGRPAFGEVLQKAHHAVFGHQNLARQGQCGEALGEIHAAAFRRVIHRAVAPKGPDHRVPGGNRPAEGRHFAAIGKKRILQSCRAGDLLKSRFQRAQGVICVVARCSGKPGHTPGAGRHDRATLGDETFGEFLDEGIGQNPLVPWSQRPRGFRIGLQTGPANRDIPKVGMPECAQLLFVEIFHGRAARAAKDFFQFLAVRHLIKNDIEHAEFPRCFDLKNPTLRICDERIRLQMLSDLGETFRDFAGGDFCQIPQGAPFDLFARLSGVSAEGLVRIKRYSALRNPKHHGAKVCHSVREKGAGGTRA